MGDREHPTDRRGTAGGGHPLGGGGAAPARARRTRFAVAALGGAATTTQLAAAGVGRSRVRSAVAAGELVECGDGVVSVPGAAGQVVLARRLRARPACVSAAAAHGLSLLAVPDRAHLAGAGARTGRLPRSVTWHRAAGGSTDLLEPVAVPDALAQLVRCRPPDEALAAVDAAVRGGRVELADLRSRFPPRGARAPRWVLDHVDPRAESVLESALRAHLLLAGITDIESQVWLAGVGRVDFVVDGWLVVEADGFENHSSTDDQIRDAGRGATALGDGLATLRFGHRSITRNPEWVIAAVQAARFRTCTKTGHFRTRLAPPPAGELR